MRKREWSILIPAVIMTLFFGIVLLQTSFIPESDDQWYSTALEQGEDWVIFCNNRILVNSLTVLIEAAGLHVWRFCSIFAAFGLFVYLQKYVCLIGGGNPDIFTNVLFLGMLF